MIELLHGDCREFLPIEADVIITDPPYGVDKRGDMLGQLAANYHGKGAHTRGYADHDRGQYQLLLAPVFDALFHSVPKGASMVAFGGNRTLHQMGWFAEEAGWEVVDILTFPKRATFARSESTLTPCTELAFWLRRPGGVRKINPNRNITNLFQIPRPQKSESPHPTTKAQAWMTRLVEVFSEPGDKILDPFAGSGSTLIAARELGRDAVGIEMLDEYHEIASERLAETPAVPR